MTEPTLASARSAEMLKQIEADPLSPDSWEELLKKVRGQNDPLSIKSLEIIIEGVGAHIAKLCAPLNHCPNLSRQILILHGEAKTGGECCHETGKNVDCSESFFQNVMI